MTASSFSLAAATTTACRSVHSCSRRPPPPVAALRRRGMPRHATHATERTRPHGRCSVRAPPMQWGRRTTALGGTRGYSGGPDLLLLLCAELLEPAKARSVSRLGRASAVHRRRTPATEQRAVKRIQRKARRAPNPSACSCARCARTSYSYASSQRLRPMTALVADPRPSPLPPRPIAAPAHRLGRCRPEPAARAARSTPRVLAMLARELGERVARRDRRVQQELLVRRHDAHLIAAQ